MFVNCCVWNHTPSPNTRSATNRGTRVIRFLHLSQSFFPLSIPPAWRFVMTMTSMTSVHLMCACSLIRGKTPASKLLADVSRSGCGAPPSYKANDDRLAMAVFTSRRSVSFTGGWLRCPAVRLPWSNRYGDIERPVRQCTGWLRCSSAFGIFSRVFMYPSFEWDII